MLGPQMWALNAPQQLLLQISYHSQHSRLLRNHCPCLEEPTLSCDWECDNCDSDIFEISTFLLVVCLWSLTLLACNYVICQVTLLGLFPINLSKELKVTDHVIFHQNLFLPHHNRIIQCDMPTFLLSHLRN